MTRYAKSSLGRLFTEGPYIYRGVNYTPNYYLLVLMVLGAMPRLFLH